MIVTKKLRSVDLNLGDSEKEIIVDCSSWQDAKDTFELHLKVLHYRKQGAKLVGAFFPTLPYLGNESLLEFEVFCSQINAMELFSIQTVGDINCVWGEKVRRLFTVSNHGFINKVIGDNNFLTATSKKVLFNKNVLLTVDTFDSVETIRLATELLKQQPRTINLACLRFGNLQNQRDALDYFDRVFVPDFNVNYVDGLEKIDYFGDEYV